MTKYENPTTTSRHEMTRQIAPPTPPVADKPPREGTPRAGTRQVAGTPPVPGPLTVDVTRTPIRPESPEPYFPTCEDLRRLIHFSLLGGHIECYDQEDYEYVAEVSTRSRSERTTDRDWLRAQVAVERARGLDPAVRFGREIESDPGLDAHASISRGWQRKTEPIDFERFDSDTASQSLFYRLQRHFECTYWLGDGVEQSPLPTDQWRQEERIRASIRAVVCLFGQRGLDENLTEGEVQEVLGSTPLKEFSPTGLFPNLHLA